jgi:hypothetical protein
MSRESRLFCVPHCLYRFLLSTFVDDGLPIPSYEQWVKDMETVGMFVGNPPMAVLKRDFIRDSFDTWSEVAIREGWGGFTPPPWILREISALPLHAEKTTVKKKERRGRWGKSAADVQNGL